MSKMKEFEQELTTIMELYKGWDLLTFRNKVIMSFPNYFCATLASVKLEEMHSDVSITLKTLVRGFSTVSLLAIFK